MSNSGEGGRKVARAPSAERQTVEAMVITRNKEGYTLHKLNLPMELVPVHRPADGKDGPHALSMIAAKLVQWVERRGFGL